MRRVFLASLFLSSGAGRAWAESERQLVARSLPVGATVTLDGNLSEEAWKSAARAETFYDRLKGTPTADATTALLLYDAQYLYIAFDCKDSQPDQIVARENVRDSRFATASTEFAEDHVDIRIDPFRSAQDSETAIFSVNALGTPSFKGSRAVKVEWQGKWEAATKRHEDGWSAEIKIPWAALNYPSAKTFAMGINFFRFQTRTRIQSCWSNVGPEFFNQRQGVLTGITLARDAFRPTFSVLPYILGSEERNKHLTKAGVDVRYQATSTLTAVASAHPDFGNVEGAVEGIGFSRSERFVAERRPFFTEGANYFEYGTFDDIGLLFYPVRRITDFDTGLKVFGKVTPVDTLGVLATVDNRRTDALLRYRHDFSSTVNAGVFLNAKNARNNPFTPADEKDTNTVTAAFGNGRWNKLIANAQLIGTSGTHAGGNAQLLRLGYQDTFNYTALTYRAVPLDFRVADGLIPFSDYRGWNLTHNWSNEWRMGPWRSFNVSLVANADNHYGGAEFRRGGLLQASWETRQDWMLGIGGEYQTYDKSIDNSYSVIAIKGVTNRFRRYVFEYSEGRQADQFFRYIAPGFQIRTLKALDLGYKAAFQNALGVYDRQNILTANYTLTQNKAIGGRIVQNGDKVNWYLSYRDAGKRGTETWFLIGDPNAERFVRRATLKFIFAF